jgi:WD40 repeat protein/DNA-binding SARP family transcriptional activator
MRLTLRLLGPPEVHLDGEPLTGLASNKVRALLFFLAVEANQRHRRETLAGLLWPDYPERSARTNLSNALSNLRTTLSDRNAAQPFLLASGETIQLNPQSDCSVDTQAFEALVAQEDALQGEDWDAAADLYRGTFLEGFSLADSPAFEQWALVVRERLRGQAMTALERRAAAYEEAGDYPRAIERARRQLDLAPWYEAAHRAVMRALALSGDRASALAQYETCARILDSELGVGPDAETTRLLDQIRDGTLTAAPPAAPQIESPYKGLRPFAEADAGDFFGRESLVRELLARLEHTADGSTNARFLAVVGPSGSGKSSVVKAGLIPALRHGALPNSEKWTFVTLSPGTHPFEELEAALLRVAVNPPESLLSQLCEDERGLLRAARRALPADPDAELVLVLDQFEELFALVDDEDVRAHLLDSLVAAVLDARSPLRVVVVLRADFVGRALEYVDFGELVRQNTAFVLPLAPNEVEQAITGPAQRVGLDVEPGLVARIVQDVGHQPGMLPLLQYALTELFERRQDNLLTLDAYRDSGGVTGALARRAEEVYAGLAPAGQEAARQFFLRLVALGEGMEGTRRRVPRAELEALQTSDVSETPDVLDRVIDAYGRYRLLTFDRDPRTRSPTVEMAHEALLREWPRLRDWLDESRGDVWMERLLGNAVAEWLDARRDPSYLLRGARLAQFEGWAQGTPLALTADERAYLQASLAGRQARAAAEAARQRRELETARALAEEQARSASRLRRWSAYLAVALLVALVAALAAGLLGNQARLRSDENALLAAENIDVARTAQVDRAAALAGEATAQAASTRAVVELGNAQTAQAQEAAQRATAEAEADLRATAEALAVKQREEARRQASIGLASQAMQELEGAFPERAVLLALEALERYPYTWQAERALGQAVLGNRLRLILRHEAKLGATQWSPDGTRVLTSDRNGTAKVWDAHTGEELLTLSGQQDLVWRAAWSPTGDRIAIASEDGTATIWEISSALDAGATAGKGPLTLAGHTDWVNWALWSLDGVRVATASDDGTAKLWNATTGDELLTLAGHTGWIWQAQWSPAGDRILTSSADGTAKVWDAITGEELLTMSQEDQNVVTAWSPDGSRILTASEDGTATVWDIAAALNTDAVIGKEIYTLSGHRDEVRWAQWSPDGSRIVTTSDDRTAKVWDGDTGVELVTFSEHEGRVHKAAWSPRGDYIVTCSKDSTARVWNAATGAEIAVLSGHTVDVEEVAWSPAGDRILTASSDLTARIWDPNPALLTIAGLDGFVSNAAWSPAGDRVARGSRDYTTRVWDADTGEELLILQGHEREIMTVFWSPSGDRMLTASLDATAKVWDATTGEELLTLSGHKGWVFAAVWSPDGTRIATSSADGTARVWDGATGDEIYTLIGHENTVAFALWSPEGTTIATASFDGTVKLWDAATGQAIRDLCSEDCRFAVSAVGWSPDGKQLITYGDDAMGRVWDADTGKELRAFPGQSGTVNDAYWSPTGERILTAGGDSTVRVWDAATGAERVRYDVSGFASASWSPDGARIAVASDDGMLTILPAWQTIHELIAQAKECCVVRDLTPEERTQFGLPVE